MIVNNLLKQFYKEIKKYKDLHITRFYSSFVFISGGKIVRMTDPYLSHCPLAEYFYKPIRHMNRKDIESIKAAITEAMKEKISKFGFFTKNRDLSIQNVVVPYGASELIMYAMKKGRVDSAVTVCDGAGTVITDKWEIVQGIGARMNGLFYTSPIKEVINKLERKGSKVLSHKAVINQLAGVREAIKLGYKNIAVTINGFANESLSEIRKMGKKYKVAVTVLIVCATGVSRKRVNEINKYADLVWSCASKEIRELTGKKAILQLSQIIPVFALTKKGLGLVSCYCREAQIIKGLDVKKQYFIGSVKDNGKEVRMGSFINYLSEEKLPVRSRKEPQ